MTNSSDSLSDLTMANGTLISNNQTTTNFTVLPLMCLFNLDCVLWPFWMDSEVEYPCSLLPNGSVIDSDDTIFTYYPEVPSVLEKLRNIGIKTAIVDKCYEQSNTRQLLKFFGWDKCFTYIELYDELEQTTLEKLQDKSKIPLNRTIYFNIHRHTDENYDNFGFLPIHVDFNYGMTMKVLDNALKKYEAKQADTVKP